MTSTQLSRTSDPASVTGAGAQTHGDVLARAIDRHSVQQLVAAGAQLVEVLPRDEFDDEHLAGALHLSLKSLTAESARVLDPGRPVIVYCWDSL